jgi:hypothetical protein
MTGDEDVPFPLVVTEGFGQLSMSERTFELARRYAGSRVAINGTTQVRAGATRPELLIFRSAPTGRQRCHDSLERSFSLNAHVRIVREPYFGKTGNIVGLPVTPMEIESGAVVRIAEIELASGGKAVVPRANIEIIPL